MIANREAVTGLKNGESALVVELRGNDRVVRKLEAMGIMPGTTVRKKCESPMRGPVVLEMKGILYAVGRGLAQRIIVEMPALLQP